ncbi:MAG: FkbM family methyltransferase [Tepidisphaera sp.]|nr:FkbM family methyltransferase [Tepidisphaera sp.]
MPDPSPADLHALISHLAAEVNRLSANSIELRRQITGLQVERLLASRQQTPRYPVEFTSQNGEDLFLWHLFHDQPRGFFIEVGAYDGYRDSVSYAFECVGWQGLLIEANPARAAQCKARRTASRVEHFALLAPNTPGPVRFTVVQDPAWDASSYALDRPMHREALDTTTLPRATVEVPVTTMDALLAQHQGPIDFASIDVEGAELELLKGFTLTRHRPRVLLLEDNTLGRDQALANYMKSQPYRFLGYLAVNQVYIHESEPDLLARAAMFRI